MGRRYFLAKEREKSVLAERWYFRSRFYISAVTRREMKSLKLNFKLRPKKGETFRNRGEEEKRRHECILRNE